MPGLRGLQALDAQVYQPASDQGELERSGLPADRRHGGPLLTGPGYPTETGPYPSAPQGSYGPSGLEDDLGNWCLAAEATRGDAPPGQQWDGGPGNHGGPFPAWGATFGQIRDGEAAAALQDESMAMHAADFGMGTGRQNLPADDYQGAHFRQSRRLSPGDTQQAGNVPPQLRTTNGGDRVQGWPKGNKVFEVGHILRRNQSDGVPYNSQWLDAAHRPMVVRQAGRKNTFDGPDSPYGGTGDESVAMMQGADAGVAVMGDPTPYTPPPDPTFGQGGGAPDESSFAGW